MESSFKGKLTGKVLSPTVACLRHPTMPADIPGIIPTLF